MGKFLAKKGSISMKKCAFCSNWYDPTNTVIAPKAGQRDVWEYTSGIKKPCTVHSNQLFASQNSCPKFSSKL